MNEFRPRAGILPVAKPEGPSSRDIVDLVQRRVGMRRVGHAGTLDPFARGLLLVAWGKATRMIPYLQEYPKTYIASIRFGRETDTQDRTGQTVAEASVAALTEERILAELPRFRGTIRQRPPMFSALKRDGRPLYKLARQGKRVPVAERQRYVERFELVEWNPPCALAEIVCSKGTYVRTLAHDLGRALGTGACLDALQRTRIGPYRVEDAVPADHLPDMPVPALAERVVSLSRAIPDWPVITVPPDEAKALAHGSWRDPARRADREAEYCVKNEAGDLLALVRGGDAAEVLRVLAEDAE